MSDTELYWMPLYMDKLLGGTTHMSAAEFGGYIKLLIHQFKKGFVPDDAPTLCKISGLNRTQLKAVLLKFEKVEDGKLINAACDKVRTEQLNKHNKGIEQRRAAIKSRWKSKKEEHDQDTGRIQAVSIPYYEPDTDIETEKEITTTSTTVVEHEFEKNILMDGQLIAMQMQLHGLTLPETEQLLQNFFKEKLATKESDKWINEEDCRKHFISWVPFALKRKTQNVANVQPKTKTPNQQFKNQQPKISNHDKTLGRIDEHTAREYLNRRHYQHPPADTDDQTTTQNRADGS